jgi:hypothetical protein
MLVLDVTIIEFNKTLTPVRLILTPWNGATCCTHNEFSFLRQGHSQLYLRTSTSSSHKKAKPISLRKFNPAIPGGSLLMQGCFRLHNDGPWAHPTLLACCMPVIHATPPFTRRPIISRATVDPLSKYGLKPLINEALGLSNFDYHQ